MNRHKTGVPRNRIWNIWGGNAICGYISQSFFLFTLFLGGFGKESISSLLLLFLSVWKLGSLILFLLFLFVLQAQSDIYLLKDFIDICLS